MSELLEGPIDQLLTIDAPGAEPAEAPLILVEYRYRGVPRAAVASVLIVTLALGITSHRRVTPPRGLGTAPVVSPPPMLARSEPKPAPVASTAAPDDADAISAVAVAESTGGAIGPLRVLTPEPAGEAPPAPPEPAVAAISPAPTPPEPPRAEPPATTPSTEEVEREILREAADREADQEAMALLKPEARRLEALERPRRQFEQRVAFRNELYAILRSGGNRAGRRIEELCDQYGCELAPAHQRAVTAGLRRSRVRPTRQNRVSLLRSYDVPEPAILEDLARSLDRRLRNARGGLRDADDVRVRAARELLAIPLTP